MKQISQDFAPFRHCAVDFSLVDFSGNLQAWALRGQEIMWRNAVSFLKLSSLPVTIQEVDIEVLSRHFLMENSALRGVMAGKKVTEGQKGVVKYVGDWFDARGQLIVLPMPATLGMQGVDYKAVTKPMLDCIKAVAKFWPGENWLRIQF